MDIINDPPPLRLTEKGAVRVGKSNVLLETVVQAFKRGDSPEAIAQSYPTATLADVYGVIAYYLRHTEQVEAHLAEYERGAEELRREIEAGQGDVTGELRARIRARQARVPVPE